MYAENTTATATVRGVPNVLVLRRKCFPVNKPQAGFPEGPWHYDWAHTATKGFTCSNDDEVTDVKVLARWTDEQVNAALNRAADDILEATEAEDQGLRDALNLMVNATAAYLSGEAADLDEVAEHGYQADLEEILSWIAQGIR